MTAENPLFVPGADEEIRTPDLAITNRLLYQLSYIGTIRSGWLKTEDRLYPKD